MVLLDEWQRLPETWDLVRRAVDADTTAGQFLLTGSASPKGPPTHSGAGRIVALRMRPLTLMERGLGPPTVSLAALLAGGRPAIAGGTDAALTTYTDEIVASGYPGLRGLRGRALRAQLDGCVQRIVEHDFEEMGHTVRRPETLLRWMAAYAAATPTTTSYEKVRDAATGDHDGARQDDDAALSGRAPAPLDRGPGGGMDPDPQPPRPALDAAQAPSG